MKPILYETKIVNNETKGIALAQVSCVEIVGSTPYAVAMQAEQPERADRYYASAVFSTSYFGDKLATREQAKASLVSGLRALADKIESGE